MLCPVTKYVLNNVLSDGPLHAWHAQTHVRILDVLHDNITAVVTPWNICLWHNNHVYEAEVKIDIFRDMN